MIKGEAQKALYDALKAGGVAGGRVYDRPPEAAVFPYVTIGDEQVIPDITDCGEFYDVACDVHSWSRPASASKAEVKGLRGACAEAALTIDNVAGYIVHDVTIDGARTLRDPDGLTEHDILGVMLRLQKTP